MGVLRSALRHGIPGEDIRHAIDNTVAVDEVAGDPVHWLVLDQDRAGNLLALVVMDRLGGPAGHSRDAGAGRMPVAAEGQARTGMNNHGHREDGTPISDADVEALADEAERGYDVDTLLRRRRGGRPPLGSAAASVESVRLDPELKRALLVRAAEEHVSVSEVIRRAIGEYLRAS
ncbi:MAG TPA: CopG family transcriptional regulator [Streptosporangiaceae bacterium]|nr:CopG family transcriptional regulator [Streptosporangiaceae bacterium]